MAILNVPIQINRGNLSDLSLITSLKEGEPYFNTLDDTLYIKNSNHIAVNISGSSYDTSILQHENGLFDFDITRNNATIGGFNITSNTWTALNSNVTIGNMKINNLRRTVLTTEMYGNNFPANPQVGQLFFKFA